MAMQRLSLLILLGTILLATPASSQAAAPIALPIDGYFERQTMKGFGFNVTPEFHQQHRELFPNNGLPNQFKGYHAGVDVEYSTPAAADVAVPVRSIAAGEVAYVGTVPGYGGLIIVRHTQPEKVTSLYGHVRLSDAPVKLGDRVTAGQTLATLGEQFTPDTSGARKHLHFGIHRGLEVDRGGHEPTQQGLKAEWYSPNDWLARYVAPPAATPTPTPIPTPSAMATPISTATGDQSAAPVDSPNVLDKLVQFLGSLFA